MKEEYTPTTDDAIDLIVAGMRVVTQLGIAPVGYPRTETDAVEAAKRWLSAHDAEVRDKALSLTEDELAIAEGAYESCIMEYEGDGLGALSIALKAVAEDRRRQ